MKPVPFACHRPALFDEALALLDRLVDEQIRGAVVQGIGAAGAPGAVLNAVNDALAPFGARVTSQPVTPEVVLKALGAL